MGLALAPIRNGEVIVPDEFKRLPEPKKASIAAALEKFQIELEAIVRQMPGWEKERREEIRKLNRDVTKLAVGHLIDELRSTYKDIPIVLEHFDQVEQDILDNAGDFLLPTEHSAPQQQSSETGDHGLEEPNSLRR